MGCGMSKQKSVRETLPNDIPTIRVYGPTNSGLEREDEVAFEEDLWRTYYKRQILKDERGGMPN